MPRFYIDWVTNTEKPVRKYIRITEMSSLQRKRQMIALQQDVEKEQQQVVQAQEQELTLCLMDNLSETLQTDKVQLLQNDAVKQFLKDTQAGTNASAEDVAKVRKQLVVEFGNADDGEEDEELGASIESVLSVKPAVVRQALEEERLHEETYEDLVDNPVIVHNKKRLRFSDLPPASLTEDELKDL